MEKLNPVFEHDCERCEWLATIVVPPMQRVDREENKVLDLYHCPGIGGGTLLARFGNDGPEYASFHPDSVESYDGRILSQNMVGLRVAFLLAKDFMLIRQEKTWKSCWEPATGEINEENDSDDDNPAAPVTD